MSDIRHTDAAGSGHGEAADHLTKFIHSLALVFTQSMVYNLEHSVTQQTLQHCFQELAAALAEQDKIDIAVVEGELVVQNNPLVKPTPAIETFVQRLSALQVANFSITAGIDEQNFRGLIELLHASPEEMKNAGGLAEVVRNVGLSNIVARRVILQQITEDDVVLSRKEMATGVGEDRVDQLVAFLRGESTGDPKAVADAIAEVTADSDTMTNVIMNGARLAETDTAREKADKLVGSVEKFYRKAASGDAVRTQKGRKNLIKALGKMGEAIVTEVERTPGETDQELKNRITAAVEGMVDELRIDSLASEYAKKHTASDTSEERILKFMKAHGMEGIEEASLHEKLLASGLSEEAWQGLLARSGNLRLEAFEGETAKATGTLGVLLTEMEKRLADTTGEAVPEEFSNENLDQLVGRVMQEVTQLTSRTENIILDLPKRVDSRKDKGGGMTKRAVLAWLAEVVQELRQPLAAISCSLSLIGEGRLGDITAQQRDMLALALNGLGRLEHLTAKLLEMSGLPSGLTPDTQILDSVNRE